MADFFCGSGTAGVVAEKMNRRWLLADQSEPAFRITRRRLMELPECRSWEAIRPVQSEVKPEETVQLAFQVLQTVGGRVLQVSLLGYELTESMLNRFTARQRVLVEEAARADWLKMIEYWDVDSDYEEGRFCARVHSLRTYGGKKLGLQSVAWQLSVPLPERENPEQIRKVAVRLVDIVGNERIIVRTLEA